jgi:hypothetical protein
MWLMAPPCVLLAPCSEAERDARNVGRAARMSAEESIAAAKERLRAQATEDIFSARQRCEGMDGARGGWRSAIMISLIRGAQMRLRPAYVPHTCAPLCVLTQDEPAHWSG